MVDNKKENKSHITILIDKNFELSFYNSIWASYMSFLHVNKIVKQNHQKSRVKMIELYNCL